MFAEFSPPMRSVTMASSLRRSSLPWRLVAFATILIVGVLLRAYPACAEIIIDDFVDDLHIQLPEQKLERVSRTNIGDLSVTRVTRASALQTDPIGFLDVNQTQPSALTVDIPLTKHTNTDPAVSIGLIYALAPPLDGVDLTQAGQNDAVILEFDRLTADVSLYQIYVLATRPTQIGTIHTSSSYLSAFRPIPQSSAPFSLVFPFDSFRLARGGPITDFDFSFISELFVVVELALFDSSLPEVLNFEMALTEVRVGRAIPEPSASISFMYLAVLAVLHFRCRRCKETYHVALCTSGTHSRSIMCDSILRGLWTTDIERQQQRRQQP
jgi:hypothetical protein